MRTTTAQYWHSSLMLASVVGRLQIDIDSLLSLLALPNVLCLRVVF